MKSDSTAQAIRLVVPDSGPLISLAQGDALDLLLAFSPAVRIAITDVVARETTSSEHADAKRISAFLTAHAERVEVVTTTIGELARAQTGPLPRDLGELSIVSLVIALRTENPGEPTLVLIEDDWFSNNAYAIPGNVHLLSTSGYLLGLEQLGLIPSSSAVVQRILSARPGFRSAHHVDVPAPKVPGGTEWRSRLRRTT